MIDENPKRHGINFIKWSFGLGVAAIVVIASLAAVDYYIEKKVNDAISDEELIKKISSRVRPSMIFDQNGSILADMGAWQFISDLNVSENTQGFVDKITISMKNPGASPILTSLDKTVDYFIRSVKGKKLNVTYELEVLSHTKPKASKSLFNLEFVSGETLGFELRPRSNKRVMYFPGKIVADGLDTIRRPGKTKLNASMGTDPQYSPIEGDSYYDTRINHWVVFSKGKWRQLRFRDDDENKN